MNAEELKQLALDCGFDHVGELDASTITVRTEVRDACAENKCQFYGKNWSCPPACGTLEECGERIGKYSKGIIVQSTQELEDSFDFEGLQELGERHAKAMSDLTDRLREQYPEALILGAGTCTRCKSCTYPDAPCRFPKKMISSMESYGMVVNEVCKANDIPYNYGKDTMTYVGCALVE